MPVSNSLLYVYSPCDGRPTPTSEASAVQETESLIKPVRGCCYSLCGYVLGIRVVPSRVSQILLSVVSCVFPSSSSSQRCCCDCLLLRLSPDSWVVLRVVACPITTTLSPSCSGAVLYLRGAAAVVNCIVSRLTLGSSFASSPALSRGATRLRSCIFTVGSECWLAPLPTLALTQLAQEPSACQSSARLPLPRDRCAT